MFKNNLNQGYPQGCVCKDDLKRLRNDDPKTELSLLPWMKYVMTYQMVKKHTSLVS